MDQCDDHEAAGRREVIEHRHERGEDERAAQDGERAADPPPPDELEPEEDQSEQDRIYGKDDQHGRHPFEPAVRRGAEAGAPRR
jgi:hypothetical protein